MQYHPHLYIQFLLAHMCIFVTMKFLLGQSNCFIECKPFVRLYKLKIAISVTNKWNRLIESQCKKKLLHLMRFDIHSCTRYPCNNMFAHDIVIKCFFIIIAFLTHTHKFHRMINYTILNWLLEFQWSVLFLSLKRINRL